MESKTFEENLIKVHFSVRAATNESGVLLTKDFEKRENPQEYFALEIAHKKFGADAVYFRYLDDNRGAIPQIYIYDNTTGLLKDTVVNINRKIWSGCQVPLFIIVEPTEVKIYDARKPIEEFMGEASSAPVDIIDILTLAGRAIKDFSAKRFDDGLFWEDAITKEHFLQETTAYKDLVEGLKGVHEQFQKKSGLNTQHSLRLLVQCLLIKYLEEREGQDKGSYFAKDYFKRHFGCNDFIEVIFSQQLPDLLEKLSRKLNGKIFEWSKEEIEKLKTRDLSSLAYYLAGDNKNQQYVLWRLYSFAHLPVELISSVYEELLGRGKKDMVYTPDVIAATLVDECMPLHDSKENFKLIDVSCGSGIFLVKAYKRIIQWWRLNNRDSEGKPKSPDLSTLKRLLKESIYGIDLREDAARLAMFSLALALLDELEPKDIWNNLHFGSVYEENILPHDFFEIVVEGKHKESYDLVIGNPPFNPPYINQQGAPISNSSYRTRLKKDWNYTCDVQLPDHNVALTFLHESMKFLKPGGLLCLIQKSGPLLYQNDPIFKELMFSKYNLLQVIDFTKLSAELWNDANVDTVAVFMENKPVDEEYVAHIVVNRTRAIEEKMFLELDHYDIHYFDKREIIDNPFIWKSNLMGGGRLVNLIKRFSTHRTLGEFLEEKEQNHKWKVGEGFIEKGVKNLADFITDKNYLPTEAFTEEKVDESKIHKCTIEHFHNPRNELIYSPPHILLKENIGKEKLLTYFSDEYLTFRDKIIGIHAPADQREELLSVFNYLNKYSDFLRAFLMSTSAQMGLSFATVPLKRDFMSLPFPEKLGDLKTNEAENIVISDLLKYQVFAENKNLLYEDAQPKHLRGFTKTFCKALNSIYGKDDRKFQMAKWYDAGRYYLLQFSYSNEECEVGPMQKVDMEEYLKSLMEAHQQRHERLTLKRLIKYYAKDTVVLAKPKTLRYWLQSIALRDADETFVDYAKAGF